MVKIQELQNGYSVEYEKPLFWVVGTDGKRIVNDYSEDKAIEKFVAWQKRQAKEGFPKPAMKLVQIGTYGNSRKAFIQGKITSFDPSDNSMWWSDGKDRNKEDTRYGTNCFEITDHNLVVSAKLDELEQKIKTLQLEEKTLLETMEKPMTAQYFASKDSKA